MLGPQCKGHGTIGPVAGNSDAMRSNELSTSDADSLAQRVLRLEAEMRGLKKAMGEKDQKIARLKGREHGHSAAHLSSPESCASSDAERLDISSRSIVQPDSERQEIGIDLATSGEGIIPQSESLNEDQRPGYASANDIPPSSVSTEPELVGTLGEQCPQLEAWLHQEGWTEFPQHNDQEKHDHERVGGSRNLEIAEAELRKMNYFLKSHLKGFEQFSLIAWTEPEPQLHQSDDYPYSTQEPPSANLPVPQTPSYGNLEGTWQGHVQPDVVDTTRLGSQLVPPRSCQHSYLHAVKSTPARSNDFRGHYGSQLTLTAATRANSSSNSGPDPMLPVDDQSESRCLGRRDNSLSVAATHCRAKSTTAPQARDTVPDPVGVRSGDGLSKPLGHTQMPRPSTSRLQAPMCPEAGPAKPTEGSPISLSSAGPKAGALDWEKNKEVVARLYLHKDRRLTNVMRVMAKDHGFVATYVQTSC